MHGCGAQSSLQSLAGRAGACCGRRADHDEDDDCDDGGGENSDDDICGDVQWRGYHEP